MTGILVVVALVAVMAAVAFFMSARGAKVALAQTKAERTSLREEAGAAKRALAEAKAEAKEKREEATSLRADLGAAKKKAFEQLEAQKRLGGAAAIREELDKVSARLAEARAEAEHQRDRVRTLERDLE
jgi:colicin import membrane protein